ncbi:MAG: TVP38/TMEM64 family protein [Tepidisphaerales bacterium]
MADMETPRGERGDCPNNRPVNLDYATPQGKQHDWRATLRRLGPAGFLAVLSMTLPALGLVVVIGTLKHSAPWLKSHGALGVLTYVTLYWPLGGFAIVPTQSYSALAGWAYGPWIGTPLALCAFTGAAVVGYFFAWYVCGDRVTQVIEEQVKWRAVYRALIGRGFWRTLGIVTLLRIPPSSPFSLTNYVMAAARVPLGPYVLGTFVGLAPRTTAVVVTFSGLKKFDLHHPEKSIYMGLWVVVTVVVVLVIARIAQKALHNITSEPRQ